MPVQKKSGKLLIKPRIYINMPVIYLSNIDDLKL